VPAPDLPLLTFADAAALDAWLADQPADSPGAWLRFAKAGAPEPTISKSDAIDCALAHGWIDGQLGGIDGSWFKTRFTPRRPRSIWSQVNRERVERLLAAGRMTPAGLREVEAAKADGRWDAAYAPASTIEVPDDLREALEAAGVAERFAALKSQERYSILFNVHDAKRPETRARRIAKYVEGLRAT
jgi:uncharacterized protein YdeI (YjbR/CyaY-like superfamily)